MSFNIDLAIVIAYMLACLGIGLFKFGKIRNIRDYTLGSKPFSTIVLMATVFATTVSAKNIIGNISKIYQLGLIFIIPLFFGPIAWFLFAKLLIPNLATFRKHKFMSLSDIMEHWYGKLGRWITNLICMLTSVGVTAVSAIAMGYLLNYFLGLSEVTGMIVGLVIVVGYSTLGGIMSVAFTDLFQFLIFFAALPIACVFGYQDTGGIEEIWSSLSEKHTQIKIDNVPLFICLILYTVIPHGGVAYVQRALIAKDEKQFLRSFITVAILIIPLLIIISLIGLITYHNNPNIESGKVLYYFIDQYLPIGIRGFMVAGLLAVIMSTQDSYLNTVSALFGHDVCKQIWPSLTDKQELLIARIFCIFVALASILVILLNRDIIEIGWLIHNFTMPLVTTPLIAALLGLRIDKKLFIFVVLPSFISVITMRFIIGIFDTRSIMVGMVTSMIILCILHKKHKKESIFSFPKIDMNSVFNKLNKRVVSHSYSISSLYSVGVVFCGNFLASLYFINSNFFNPLNVSLVATGCLFLLLLLNELWSSFYLKNHIVDIWRGCLIMGLIFIPSYMLFMNGFNFFFLCNFILSAILYIMMSDIAIGLLFILIAGSIGYLLPKFFIYKVNLINETFAYISCGAMILGIVLQFYKKHSITKTVYEEMLHELKVVMQERIAELSNVKEEFLNKLNHELRIPLSVMINTSDGIYRMWDNLSDQNKKKYLRDIVDNRQRFESYTSNILDLASLKQNKFELAINENIDLVELAKAVIEDAQSLVIKYNKNLKIELEVKNTKSANICCDEKRIEQVLQNLLSNAIKYSNEGVIKLHINVVLDEVEISVSDDGVGVPDSEKKKIFEPFFEGSRTKSSAEGKGLGLSVAQQIIILHGGYIKVEDNKQRGSVFKLILPYNNIKQNQILHSELEKRVS